MAENEGEVVVVVVVRGLTRSPFGPQRALCEGSRNVAENEGAGSLSLASW